ncbi:hypothetical protein [Streptomyces sp. NPDC051776]|uniref:hypothetical protein n=1 Tax=Streptomyces sp. NPDC051776 TaxID=3155414 RepID=UPI0034220604
MRTRPSAPTRTRRDRRDRARRQSALVCLLAVPVLALSAVACTGDGGDRASEDRPAAGDGKDTEGSGRSQNSNTEEEKGVRPLTKAELTSALLTKSDVSGYEVEHTRSGGLTPENPTEIDRKECRAIADTIASKPSHRRTASVNATLAKGAFGGSGTFQALQLSSWADGEARAWLGELRKATGVCASFTGTRKGGGTTEFTVGDAEGADAGDESVTFSLREKDSGDGKNGDGALIVTVVRSGANTATYLSLPMAGKADPVEEGVAAEQHEKLKAAADG